MTQYKKLQACLPPVSSILYKNILALKANRCCSVKLAISFHHASFPFIFIPLPSVCRKDEKELLKEKKKGKERNNELSYYASISKYQSFESGDTTIESKVKTCQNLLRKQQRFLLSHKMPHWTLWNQMVED